jgi:PKD repeat protein
MTTDVRIFPGFEADFAQSGVCNLLPFQFTDQTKTRYGVVNKWHWDFGVQELIQMLAMNKIPLYTFNGINQYNVTLIAMSNKGCTDTVIKPVEVTDKPGIDMNFRDTLICSQDSLMLHAGGAGNFSWTPGYNIINSNTATPVVFPKKTTTILFNWIIWAAFQTIPLK